MSSYECKLPENPKPLHTPAGYTMPYFPELEFPRKLENCDVDIWRGSNHRGTYSTDEFEIWLLAPNIIKMNSGYEIWELYNVSSCVTPHRYPKKE